LFKFDPQANKVFNLGKPVVAQNIRSLLIEKDLIYGLAGEYPEAVRLFTYDLKEGSFAASQRSDQWEPDFPRFWMLPVNNTYRSSFSASSLVNLGNGWMVIGEDDLLPALLFHKLD
jgi:hypothetical protein